MFIKLNVFLYYYFNHDVRREFKFIISFGN